MTEANAYPLLDGLLLDVPCCGAKSMSLGAHLSHAARCAFEALRLHIACMMHLEEGGAALDDDAVADLLAGDGLLADRLQAIVDDGHQQVSERVANAPALRRVL